MTLAKVKVATVAVLVVAASVGVAIAAQPATAPSKTGTGAGGAGDTGLSLLVASAGGAASKRIEDQLKNQPLRRKSLIEVQAASNQTDVVAYARGE